MRRYSGTSERGYRDSLRDDARRRFAVELSEAFFDEINAAIGRAYEGRLQVIAGAERLAVSWSKARAVASSSSLDTLHFKLRTIGLDALFGEHVYSADSVGVGKPDPALFLYSAEERLRVRPLRA